MVAGPGPGGQAAQSGLQWLPAQTITGVRCQGDGLLSVLLPGHGSGFSGIRSVFILRFGRGVRSPTQPSTQSAAALTAGVVDLAWAAICLDGFVFLDIGAGWVLLWTRRACVCAIHWVCTACCTCRPPVPGVSTPRWSPCTLHRAFCTRGWGRGAGGGRATRLGPPVPVQVSRITVHKLLTAGPQLQVRAVSAVRRQRDERKPGFTLEESGTARTGKL